MGSIAALFMYLMIIGFIAVVAYFVIKKAIKDALKEYHNENNNYFDHKRSACNTVNYIARYNGYRL